jgi:isoleucyl-tRNA synthetase
LAEKWDRLLHERSEVLKALEQARTSGIIGHSLDAKVVITPGTGSLSIDGQGPVLVSLVQEDQSRSQDLLIVSQANYSTEAETKNSGEVSSYDAALLNRLVTVSKADGAKCERCWKYDVQVGADKNHPTVCARCAAVLNGGAAA